MKAVLIEFHQAFANRDYDKVVKCGEGIDIADIHQSDERRRVIHRLAIAYQEIGASNNSLDLYRRLVRDYPDFQAGWEFFAQFFEKQKDYESALAHWEEVADKFPKSTLAYWSIGNIYKNNLKDYDKAIEMYQKQIERFPERQSGYQGVAESLQDAKRYNEALLAWECVKKKFPKEPKSYWAIGHIYLEQQKYGKAELAFQEQLAYFPNRKSGLEGLKKVNQYKNSLPIEKYYQQKASEILNTQVSDFDHSEIIGIRTHLWTSEVAELYNILLGYFKPEQIFVVMEEMNNKPSVPVPSYINKISLNDKFLNHNRLLTTSRNVYNKGMGWLCGDYFYYALMKNIKSEYYWLVEPDVRFTFSDMKAFFQQSHNYPDKNLLISFRKASEKWMWYKSGKRIADDVFQCLFPFSRLTFKAVQVSLLERQRLTTYLLNDGLDIYHYPNDEAVVATAIKKYGFEAIDFKEIYGEKLYQFFSLSDIKTLPLSDQLPKNRIIHPARSLDYLGDKIDQVLKKQLNESFDKHIVNGSSVFDLSQYISKKLSVADIYLTIRKKQYLKQYKNHQIRDGLSVADSLYELARLYQENQDFETAESILIDVNKLFGTD